MMVRDFSLFWKNNTAGKALPLKNTPRQIVTIASLIETES